jgi:hypothetical protein
MLARSYHREAKNFFMADRRFRLRDESARKTPPDKAAI